MRLYPLAALPLFLLACGSGSGDSRDGTSTAATPATTSGASADTTAAATTVEPTTTAADPTTTAGSAAATSSSSTTDPTTTGDPSDSTTQISTATDDSTGPQPKLDFPPVDPIPVHEIPGLESITFYETTGQVTEYTFLVDGPELSNLLVDPLSSENKDIQGTSVEFYDVYYSDVDGVFDPDGSYLTIAGSFGAKLPAGGGLNLAEISLNSAIAA